MKSRTTTRHLSIFNRAALLMITLLVLTSLMVSTVFAAETNSSSPSRAATNGKSWTNISYSFASDNLYATARKSNKQLRLSNFNIPGIPGNSIINGIAVTVEGLTTGMQASVSLTYNGGSTYTTTALPTALTASESVVTLGGATETWGRTWNAGEFTNSKFGVRLVTTGAPNLTSTISVDQVQVKVYYTPPQTTLILDPVTGPYTGTAPMSATLKYTSDGTLISGRNINFYVGGTGLNADGSCSGTLVGTVATQVNTGTATLPAASLGSISSGTYPYGACASFAGEANLQGTSITNTLTVNGTGTTLVAYPATGTYGETISLSAKLTQTSNGTGINNEFITFYLFGNELGSAKTNNQGVATLPNVALTEFYNAGSSENIVAEFAGEANYNPASATALITINPRPITVTAVTDTKVYDGTTSSAGIPTITAGTLVTGDLANFTQVFDTKDAGSNKTLTPTGAVDDGNSGLNYTVTPVSVNTGVITKATVNVKADDKSKAVKPVNAADPTFTVQYIGLLGSDTAAEIDVTPNCSVAVAHNLIGTYPITCSGGSDNNYDFTFTNGTLSVVDAKLGADTVGVFRPSNGVIYLKNNFTSGFADIALNYGLGGDYPVVGDWDGNGTDTIGVYRGNTFLLRNSNTVGFANISFVFGQAGDQPVAGDWDGDGIDTIGIYRPSKGLFLLRNSNSAGTPDITFFLGNVGDVGIAGDWNGDGIDTTGVFRPSNGVIFLKNANTTGYADVALNYGLAGDKPVVGDWDNNGTTTIGVYRGNKFLLRNSNTVGFANISLDLGNTGDMPIAGNWDGLP